MNNENMLMFPQPIPNANFNYEIKNILNQINGLHQEIRRLERRILNLEKNIIPTPLDELKPTPLEYNNMNYTNDNYII